MRKHFVEVLAESMWEQHAQERGWSELNDLEQEQVLMEAQHCIESLTIAGWAIIAQATQEEFDEAMRMISAQVRAHGNEG